MLVRLKTRLAIASLLAMASGAQAIGFGKAPGSATLGAQLDFAVPLRLEADESVNSACVSAEVTHGDQLWRRDALRLSLENGASAQERVLRVRTAQPLVEPVVAVSIVINCGSQRLTRRFTAFVDPPDLDRPPVVTDASPAAPPAIGGLTLPGAVASSPAADAPPASRSAGRGAAAAPRRRAPAPSAPSAPDAGAAAAAPVAAAPASPAPASRRAAVVAPPTSKPQRVAQADVLRLPPGANRLRLEDETPEFFPDAGAKGGGSKPLLPFLVDVVQAADAAASAAERSRALEASLQQLQVEAKTTRDRLNQMQGKVADAESINRLAPWLGAGLALMAALAAWFGWRLRQLQQQTRHAQWLAAAEAEAEQASDSSMRGTGPGALADAAHPASAIALPEGMTTSEPAEVHRAGPVSEPDMLRAVAARVADATAEPAMQRTQVLEPGAAVAPQAESMESTPQRAVAIEELLDLEQQAEFFIVLGQDDAAIDLLVGHIRSTGGASPLPYLKLLELYRRTGDNESYERTRQRFNHRFNAYAPDWDEDMAAGRALEDYPAVLKRLQRLWRDPLDAMAELEALLFRRDDGDLFHLPAYRELLFLYSVVRDVYDHLDTGTGNVDVLLPLGNDEAALSMPGELFGASDHAHVVDTGGMPLTAPATAPGGLDLDLGAVQEPPVAKVVGLPGDSGFSFTLDPPPERKTPR